MGASSKPTARQTEVVVQDLKGEVLIYDLKINKAYCLNETSALVYNLCDGNHSVSEIRESIARKLKQPVTEDFVWLAIDQLKEDNLLENASEIEVKLKGLSRREAIRKVGLASMIALPLITSLIAPTAAMAASAGSCVNPGGAPSGTGVPTAVADCADCQAALNSLCCSNAATGVSCFSIGVGSNFCAGTCT